MYCNTLQCLAATTDDYRRLLTTRDDYCVLGCFIWVLYLVVVLDCWVWLLYLVVFLGCLTWLLCLVASIVAIGAINIVSGPIRVRRPLGGLLEVSWNLKKAWSVKGSALGRLLGRCWGRKSNLEQLLAAPRGIPRQVSAILVAKRLPKGRPRGSKIESNRRLQLKTRFLQKVGVFGEIL